MEDLINEFIVITTKLDIEDRNFTTDLQNLKLCLEDMERAFARQGTEVEEAALLFQKMNVCPVIYELTVKLNDRHEHWDDTAIVDAKYMLYSVLTNVTAYCSPALHTKLAQAKVLEAVGRDLEILHECSNQNFKDRAHEDVSNFIYMLVNIYYN